MLVGAQVSAKLFSAFVQGREENIMLGWQTYWLIPCIAAAVIMVLFALLFKAKEQSTENAD